MIKVKSQAPEEEIELKDYTVNKKGKVVEYNDEAQQKELAKVIPIEKTITNFNDLTTKEFEARLERRLKAVEAIKKHFIVGRHFMDLPRAEKSILTQEGADLLFASAGVAVTTIEVKEILDHEKEFYFVI